MSHEKEHKNSLEYIPLCEASRQTGYTPEYLNSLARKGKLHAKKIGRNWHTTSEWLEDFVRSTKESIQDRVENIGQEIKEVTPEKDDTTQKKIFQAEFFFNPEDKEITEEKFLSVPAEIKFKRRKIIGNFTTALLAVFLVVLFFQTLKFSATKNGGILNGLQNIFPKNNSAEILADKSSVTAHEGIVEGEEITALDLGTQTGPALVSENFKIKEIKFGGAIAVASAAENAKFEIYNIRSEVVKTKNKEENKLLIRWDTSKLALSSLEYSVMSGSNPKKLKEDNYSFGHSALLTGLEPGTAYTFVISGRDRWGNEIASDRYSTYTGTKTVSVFDLIVNSVKETFSWAIKK